MNSKNLLKVADAIENESLPGLGYEQGDWLRVSDCGTTACIAGWAYCIRYGVKNYMKLHQKVDGDWGNSIRINAMNYLGLSEFEAADLFEAIDATREQAVCVLRHAAETHEVNWFV